ncbi:MAG: dephospho-CoA kinase [candidate division WOR-3 bacterium]|nr:dephospho-CoA kinase [candidate division WOR-3 bacterium]
MGIGGNIGAGKTTVAKMLKKLFEQHKIPVKIIVADKIAWQLYQSKDSPVYKKILKKFGIGILTKNNAIDRKKLAKLVFACSDKLKSLNFIIQGPLIKQIIKELKTSTAPVTILDAALLFNWGKQIPLNYRILVTAPQKQKIARMTKKNYQPAEIKLRLKSQMSEVEMKKYADFVIHNNQNLDNLKKSVRQIFDKLLIMMTAIKERRQ